MKGKRIIALLLVHLYLLTVVAPVACALSCPCIDGNRHRQEDPRTCLCYGRPDHQHLEAHDCCGHNHDTRIELYTFDRETGRESVRTALPVIAALPSDETLRPLLSHQLRERIPTPPESCHCELCARPSVLRAPPVLA